MTLKNRITHGILVWAGTVFAVARDRRADTEQLRCQLLRQLACSCRYTLDTDRSDPRNEYLLGAVHIFQLWRGRFKRLVLYFLFNCKENVKNIVWLFCSCRLMMMMILLVWQLKHNFNLQGSGGGLTVGTVKNVFHHLVHLKLIFNI